MSIADELTQLATDISNAYSAINTKGGTIPANKNTNNLATAISTISGSAKPEETKTVALDMANGDQVVTPTAGSVLTQVTVEKPSTMIPSNIKKNITIGGVTGTLEAEETDIVADYSNILTLGAGALRPSASWVGNGLKRINLPNLTSVGNYVCYQNTTLKKVEMPSLTSSGISPFYGCTNLEYLDVSSLTTLPTSFASNCSSLQTLILPYKQISSVNNDSFSWTSLTKWNFPTAILVNDSAFRALNYVQEYCYFNFPLVETIEARAFYSDNIYSICLPAVTAINNIYAFYNNSNMTALILGTTNCTLANTQAFLNTNPNFYVPASSVETYKSATNWSAFASKIFGVYENADKAINETFTPTVSDPDIASSIVSWDYIGVNQATATVNSATGQTTITGVGCFEGTNKSSQILLRGLDSSNNPVYNCLINITQVEV